MEKKKTLFCLQIILRMYTSFIVGYTIACFWHKNKICVEFCAKNKQKIARTRIQYALILKENLVQ